MSAVRLNNVVLRRDCSNVTEWNCSLLELASGNTIILEKMAGRTIGLQSDGVNTLTHPKMTTHKSELLLLNPAMTDQE